MMTTVLLLTVVMGLQAQSIVGTWETVIETDDNDKVTVDVTFEQGNDVLIKGQLKIGEGEEGTMVMSVTFPGTYQQNGQTLTLNFDANKGKINIDEAIFPKEVEDLLADDPDKRKDVLKMMQDQVDESLAKELGDSLPLDGDLTIVKLTDTELVLNDGDDNVTFTKVK
ncbi:MAG: hypothetical protein IKZ62_07865 [Prevotella sp.]|nr:hypothetical protein [Prevotella sp.]